MRQLAMLTALMMAFTVLLTGCGTKVPDVRGISAEDAIERLTSAGFEVSPLEYNESTDGSPGIVVEQRPAAGERIDEESIVSLIVQGPPPVEVPAVVGMASDEASAALAATGLNLGAVSETYNDSVAAGIVVAQSPESEAQALKGSDVTLVISMGPQPIAVPQVQGKTEAEAQEILQDAGFSVAVERRNDDSAKGTVLSQTPAEGDAVPGSTVTLVVSEGIELVRVPNIAGMIDPDPTIKAAGLIPKGISIHGPVESDAAGIGEAYRQQPAAGTMVPKGSTVSYHFWWEAG